MIVSLFAGESEIRNRTKSLGGFRIKLSPDAAA